MNTFSILSSAKLTRDELYFVRGGDNGPGDDGTVTTSEDVDMPEL